MTPSGERSTTGGKSSKGKKGLKSKAREEEERRLEEGFNFEISLWITRFEIFYFFKF